MYIDFFFVYFQMNNICCSKHFCLLFTDHYMIYMKKFKLFENEIPYLH